jgi:predicted Zn-dependent protease
VVLNSSVALSRAGYYERADVLLYEAIKRKPDNIIFYFAIIENSIRADKAYKAEEYTKKLFLRFDQEQIRHGLENYTDNPRYAPISKELIAPVILDTARK